MNTRENPPAEIDMLSWVSLWVLLVAAVAIFTGGITGHGFDRFIKNGVRTQATVVKLSPEYHGTLLYQYEVEGVKFEGQSPPSPPNPQLEDIAVGQSVEIYYDPHDPSDSVLGDPKPMRTNARISVGLAAVIIPTLIVFAVMAQKQYRKPRKD